MAGRSGKPRTASPRPRVEDSETLPFAIDRLDIGPIAAAPTTANRALSAKGKPHHSGHRGRLRERFDMAGVGALQDYELLELFLFRTIPRRDTKLVAKQLLEAFGNDLPTLLAAPPENIARIAGAGPAVAQDLKLLQAFLERASKADLRGRTVISSWSALVNYCRAAMANEPREQFRVLFLDAKNGLIRDEVMNQGTVDHAPVYPREIARRALELSAAAVILVHNHPSGDPKPSPADIAITREIVAAAATIGVRVHDHLVIGRNGAESFKSLGLL